MTGYNVRMLTLHLDCRRIDDPVDAVDDSASRLLEARDQASSSTSVEIETVRVTLDWCSIDQGFDVVESRPAGEVLVSIGNYRVNDEALELVSRAVEEGYFAALLMQPSWEEARTISKLLHDLAEKEPSYPTRLGVNVYGERIHTPFYPLSSSLRHGVLSTALTYPNYLLDAYSRWGYRGLLEAVESAGRTALRVLEEASAAAGYEPSGVDLSVAPWMRETSLGLVEYVAGVRLPEPGFAYGLYLVNKALREAAESLDTVGFNEVQLPVAEDLKMKARVSELETTARDLARLTGVCLAGLDLAVVPAGVDAVAGLLLELAGYAHSRGKVLGARIIPVSDVEPGDKVYLDKFGETPVMPI